MDIDALKGLSEAIGRIQIPNIAIPEPIYPKFEIPEMPVIDPEDTIIGEIKRKIETQNDLVSQQIGILAEQNKLLADNYSKLKEVYDAQTESYKSAQEDLKRSRKYNVIMMIVSILAMLAAIAGPIATILVSK